jgi:hypothetical protein
MASYFAVIRSDEQMQYEIPGVTLRRLHRTDTQTLGYVLLTVTLKQCRSQWPRALRHGVSSLAGMLDVGSSPTRSMEVSVHVYSNCVALSCLATV